MLGDDVVGSIGVDHGFLVSDGVENPEKLSDKDTIKKLGRGDNRRKRDEEVERSRSKYSW